MKRIVPFSLDSFHIFLLAFHIPANQNPDVKPDAQTLKLSRADNLHDLLLSDWLRRRQISHVLRSLKKPTQRCESLSKLKKIFASDNGTLRFTVKHVRKSLGLESSKKKPKRKKRDAQSGSGTLGSRSVDQ